MLSRRGLIGGGVVLAGILAAQPALALTLDEAKAAGRVGEMPTGYVGIVESGPGVQELVDSVNARRQVRYKEIAEREGAPLTAVEQLAGARLIERAGPGEFVADANGAWVRK